MLILEPSLRFASRSPSCSWCRLLWAATCEPTEPRAVCTCNTSSGRWNTVLGTHFFFGDGAVARQIDLEWLQRKRPGGRNKGLKIAYPTQGARAVSVVHSVERSFRRPGSRDPGSAGRWGWRWGGRHTQSGASRLASSCFTLASRKILYSRTVKSKPVVRTCMNIPV